MAKTTAKGKAQFKHSLIDRFQDWVERLPVRALIFYVVVGIVLILVQILFLWLDGALQVEQLLPILIFNALAIPGVLGLMHLLDHQAVTALNSMRPVLDMTESEIDKYEYELSNMRSLTPLLVGLILVVSLILSEQVLPVPVRYAAMEQMPVFAVVYHVIDKATAFFMGVFVYHTIRQLRLVNAINSSRIRINLFNLGPLKAFSRLTALTAVGLVLGVYGWMLINPELMKESFNVVFVVLFTILAVLVFVLPLYSVHRLMEKAKEGELDEIDLRFEAVFSKFNKGFLDDDDSAVKRLNRTIASLEIQHRRVNDIDTWPWGSETVRFALSVIALPLVLTILRFLVEEAFGW
jgi:hypothetical protein